MGVVSLFSALPGGDNNGRALVQAFGHGHSVISGGVPHGFDEFSLARDSSLAGEHGEGVAARQSRPWQSGCPPGAICLPRGPSVSVWLDPTPGGWRKFVSVLP